MGRWGDKQAQAAELMRAAVVGAVPPGETLQGVVYGNQQSTFSAKLFVLGVTEQHLIVQEVDRKWNTKGAPVVATPADIEVGNVFADGAGLLASFEKESQIRFTARGEKYKLNILGGTWLYDKLAGEEQAQSLQFLVDFMSRARR